VLTVQILSVALGRPRHDGVGLLNSSWGFLMWL